MAAAFAPGQGLESASDLTGRVYCGYQGWFRTPEDGSGQGWVHWGPGRFEPGRCTVDLWPDVSELGPEERVATPFRHADGSLAYVFSSHNERTVDRHFRWMKQYDIDGVFVQRFVHMLDESPRSVPMLRAADRVLSFCRAGAARHERKLAVMYDLSPLKQGRGETVVSDCKRLLETLTGDDASYIRHRGRPLVALWGVGFSDAGRDYTLADCEQIIDRLRDELAGSCSILLGVPFFWRTQKRDAVADKNLHRVIKKADVVSPWSVGRYRSPEEVETTVQAHWTEDRAWCEREGLTYMPVAFPGFSWQNLQRVRGREAELDAIPRRGGAFFESQFIAARRAGASTVYVAMFDEVDEGTAIFKCTANPPVGDSAFSKLDGVPSDHYLKLAARGRRVLRGE